MKIKAILLVLALMLCLSAAAFAAPALTDGTVTAWIDADNTLSLRNGDGVIHKLNTRVDDLLSMDENTLYLVDHSRQLIAVRKDGSLGNVLLSKPTDTELEAWKETRYTLKDGVLFIVGEGEEVPGRFTSPRGNAHVGRTIPTRMIGADIVGRKRHDCGWKSAGGETEACAGDENSFGRFHYPLGEICALVASLVEDDTGGG